MKKGKVIFIMALLIVGNLIGAGILALPHWLSCALSLQMS